MNRKVSLLLLFLFISTATAYEIEDVCVTVYRDGYCHISQTFSVEEDIIVVIPLFGEHWENVLVTGDTVLDYEISENELIVDTGSSTQITVEYDTPDLTDKEGMVWTIEITTPVPITLALPHGMTVVDLSDVPLKISETVITLPEGTQTVSYFFTTEEESGHSILNFLLVACSVIGVVGTYLFWKIRTKFSDLPKEEKKIVKFLEEHGDSLSSTIRKSLKIPRTTAWRRFNRMEEKGIIEIERGKENYIKLKRL